MLRDNLPLVFLKKFALKLTRDDDRANDLCHDTVVKMLENEKTFDGSNIQGWAGKIMYHLFVDQLKRKKEIYSDAPGDISVFPNQEYYTDLNLIAHELLKTEKGKALLMVAQGFTYDEISAKQNVPVGTIKSRVHRAKL